jgi:hypothetical protein
VPYTEEVLFSRMKRLTHKRYFKLEWSALRQNNFIILNVMAYAETVYNSQVKCLTQQRALILELSALRRNGSLFYSEVPCAETVLLFHS